MCGGEGATGSQWGEARAAAEHPTCLLTKYLASKSTSLEAEEPWAKTVSKETSNFYHIMISLLGALSPKLTG